MRRLLRVLGSLFLLWLVTTIILAAANWSFVTRVWTYNTVVIPPFYSAPADKTEAQAQDIEYLRQLLAYDRSFSDAEQTAFLAFVDQLALRAGQMSDAEFYLAVAEAAAISGNGHTNVSFAPPYRAFNRAGIDVFWFADGLFIVRAHRDHADLVGRRIVSIEGRTPEGVNDQLARYTGGAPAWQQLQALRIVRSPALMHAAGLAASSQQLTLTVEGDAAGGEESPNGKLHTVVLTALPAPVRAEHPRRRPIDALRPTPMPDEEGAWHRTLSVSGDDAPLYLRQPDENFLWTKTSSGGVYLRPKILVERNDAPVLDTFTSVLRAKPKNGFAFMVVDLRFSPGGDYTTVIEFSKAAPQAIREDGRLYIVTGPQTFSAALVFAAMLKYYGGDKARIVGERLGDDEQFWAETGFFPFRLPNTRYAVNFATGYHDWANGCGGRHRYCFDLNVEHEVAAGSLSPVVKLAPRYADYAAGRDIVMDYVLDASTR